MAKYSYSSVSEKDDVKNYFDLFLTYTWKSNLFSVRTAPHQLFVCYAAGYLLIMRSLLSLQAARSLWSKKETIDR
jgi:hypothetical protein